MLVMRPLEVDVVVGERIEVETGGGEPLLGGPRVGVGGGDRALLELLDRLQHTLAQFGLKKLEVCLRGTVFRLLTPHLAERQGRLGCGCRRIGFGVFHRVGVAPRDLDVGFVACLEQMVTARAAGERLSRR